MGRKAGRGRLVRSGLAALSLVTVAFVLFEFYRLAAIGLVALVSVCMFLLIDLRRRSQAVGRTLRRVNDELSSVDAALGALGGGLKELRSNVGGIVARSRVIEAQLAEGLGEVRELRLAGRSSAESLENSIRSAEIRLIKGVDEVASVLANEREAAETRYGTVTASLRRLLHEPVAQLQALDQLRARLGNVAERLPLLGGWAIDPTTALLLSKDIAERRPACVVECGSGSSTVWIAEMLRQTGAGYLISIEHDAHYARLVGEMLSAHGLSDWAEVRHAPLTQVMNEGSEFTWYETAALAGIENVQLMLVDGPPASTGTRARYPAVPVLASRLEPGARIILDDARRTDERQTISQWQSEGLVEAQVTRVQSAVVLTRS